MPKSHDPFKNVRVESDIKPEGMYLDLKEGFNDKGKDSDYCSASGKYMCIHSQGGGGKLQVWKLGCPGRKERDKQTFFTGLTGHVSASRWSPHTDGLLAAGDVHGVVIVHFFHGKDFDDDGYMINQIEKPTTLCNTDFGKPITDIAWNPCVQNLFAVSSKANNMKFFDAASGEQALDGLELTFDNVVHSIDWSWDGVHICCIEKTGAKHTLHVFNVRSETPKTPVFSKALGLKAARSLWLNTTEYQHVCAIGVDAGAGKRVLKVFDIKGDQLGRNQSIPEAGTSGLSPTWDAGRELLWYYTKGDLSVSFMRYKSSGSTFKSLGIYRYKDSIKGGCFVNQREMDTKTFEIAQFYALRQERRTLSITPTPFIVPRKTGFSAFEKELYPDVISTKPAMTLSEYEQAEVSQVKLPLLRTMDPNVEINEDGEAVFIVKMSYAELETKYNSLLQLCADNGINTDSITGSA